MFQRVYEAYDGALVKRHFKWIGGKQACGLFTACVKAIQKHTPGWAGTNGIRTIIKKTTCIYGDLKLKYKHSDDMVGFCISF